MRVLFDLLHPAHYHLFKNVITSLQNAGDEVVIIARQKDCLADLLEQSGLSYRLIPRKGSGLIALAVETIKAAFMAAGLARKKHIDYMVGTSISIGPAARLTGSKSIMFEEDDAKVVPVFAKLGYPIAHYVVTPNCLAFENHGRKHLTYPGYHELAYLHPQRFTPDPNIRNQLGIGTDEKYFLVRLVSLTAHHDIGKLGISSDQAGVLVEHLSKYGRVFISAEKTVDERLRQYLLPTAPEQILDVMAFANLVVGDSQTMAAEASVLGTPSLRCNSFVGRLSYLEELEHKYGLTMGIKPENFDKLLETAEKWVLQDDIKQQWQAKRQVMLDDCVDVTTWIVELFHKLKCNKS